MNNIVKKQELTWYKLEDMPEEWKDHTTLLCQEFNGALFLATYTRDEYADYFWVDQFTTGRKVHLFVVEMVAAVREK